MQTEIIRHAKKKEKCSQKSREKNPVKRNRTRDNSDVGLKNKYYKYVQESIGKDG